MPITRKNCPTCKMPVQSATTHKIAGLVSYMYNCGHSEMRAQLTRKNFEDFVSLDGKRPFRFQIDGALFGIESNARLLIADEMRLGKTVQACMIAWSHQKDLCKTLTLCKSSLMIQWMKEQNRWCSQNGQDWIVQILESENDFLMPGVKGYILSYDMLWRFKDIKSFVERTKIKCVIMDEIQHLKNTDSKRTNGVRAVCKHVEHIIALSGTPIKNHAGEYFPILNILRPDLFPTKSNFDMQWVDTYWDGNKMKYGGLKNYERFKQYTKDFIIRRTRDEVFTDFPKTMRDFRFCELGAEVEKAYKDTFKQFQDYYLYESAGDAASAANILSYLTKMRHLTGIAKIEPVIDYVSDFLDETDRKLTIFVHHRDVAKTLTQRIEQIPGIGPVLSLSSDMGITDRDNTVQLFAQDKYRVLVASTLASGEGLNLGMCSDYIMMERQWNPANEEQAESRFPSVEKLGQTIQGTYMTAVGTVDEFFGEIVEKKRSSVANTLDGKEIKWQESSIMQELAAVLASNGGKRWGW